MHVKNVTHLKEISKYFKICEFVEAQVVKGLNPRYIFVAHLKYIRYSNLTRIFTSQEVEEKPIVSTNVQPKNMKQSKPRTI